MATSSAATAQLVTLTDVQSKLGVILASVKTTWDWRNLLDEGLRKNLLEVCQKNPRDFSFTPQEVEKTLRAFGILNLEWKNLGEALQTTLLETCQMNAQNFTSQEIGSMFWAFAKLGLKWRNLDKTLQIALLEICRKNVQDFMLQEIIKILKAFVELGLQWKDLDEELRITLLDACQKDIWNLIPPRITDIFWAFVELGLQWKDLGETLQTILLGICRKNARGFTLRGIEDIFWTFAELGLQWKDLDEELRVALLDAYGNKSLAHAVSQETVSGFWSLAKLGMKWKDLKKELQTALIARICQPWDLTSEMASAILYVLIKFKLQEQNSMEFKKILDLYNDFCSKYELLELSVEQDEPEIVEYVGQLLRTTREPLPSEILEKAILKGCATSVHLFLELGIVSKEVISNIWRYIIQNPEDYIKNNRDLIQYFLSERFLRSEIVDGDQDSTLLNIGALQTIENFRKKYKETFECFSINIQVLDLIPVIFEYTGACDTYPIFYRTYPGGDISFNARNQSQSPQAMTIRYDSASSSTINFSPEVIQHSSLIPSSSTDGTMLNFLRKMSFLGS